MYKGHKGNQGNVFDIIFVKSTRVVGRPVPAVFLNDKLGLCGNKVLICPVS